jgi:serine/threonine protein kinase
MRKGANKNSKNKKVIKNKKTQIKNLKMKYFLSKKKDKNNNHFFKRNLNTKGNKRKEKKLVDPLKKLQKLRSSRVIESDLFKKLEKRKKQIEMIKSNRLIQFENNSFSQKKISTSRRASRVEQNNSKYFSINKSIKMLSQRYIPNKKNFRDNKIRITKPSYHKVTSIESKSTKKIMSNRNIASIELPEMSSKKSLSKNVSRDFKTFTHHIEEIEEVESIEENINNSNQVNLIHSNPFNKSDSNASVSIKINTEHKSFKKEIENKLKSIVNESERLKELKTEIPQKFKYWKKNDLAEIYNFKTNINFYEIIKKIGKGSFGKVFLAKQILTGTEVALKVISKKSLKKKNAEKRIQKEINILKKIPSHPNIISLLEIFQDSDYHYLVFEFAPLGDLVSYFFKEDLFPENQLRRFFKDFLVGLEHIHQAGIIHRDIKPDNILMDTNFMPKIADFGISNIHESNSIIEDTGGTPLYLSPEVIENEGKIGFQTDIWSSGIVLYLLVFGDTPFKGRNMNELFLQILSKEVSFDMSTDFNDDQSLVQDLIKKMLIKDPTKRITLEEIKKHPWFTQKLKNEQRTYLSNSEVEDEHVNLYEEQDDSKQQSKQVHLPERMVNSCRNIINYSWATEEKGKLKKKGLKLKPLVTEINDIYNLAEKGLSPEHKKFINNTSTYNTNKNSPTSLQKPNNIGQAFSAIEFRESMVKEVIVDYFKSLGFPKEYIEQSIHPQKKIYNHIRGCFVNLRLIL